MMIDLFPSISALFKRNTILLPVFLNTRTAPFSASALFQESRISSGFSGCAKMFLTSSHLRFFLYSQHTDMRKGFDGLYGLVSTRLQEDPLSGDVYVFLNRRRDRMKMLFWDGTGFWIFYKRLERGTFQRPRISSDNTLFLPYEEIVMMIEGIDLDTVKRRKRYIKKPLAA